MTQNVYGLTETSAQKLVSVLKNPPVVSEIGEETPRHSVLGFATLEITGNWTRDGDGAYKTTAKRLFRNSETKIYQARDGAQDVDLYAPCANNEPPHSKGDKVSAAWNGGWELISGSGSGTPSERAEVQEPCRRPLFRSIELTSFGNNNLEDSQLCIDGNSILCFGSIKRSDKIYWPIPATYAGGELYQVEEENDEGEIEIVTKKRRKGEQVKDKDDKPLYLKAREPRVGWAIRARNNDCYYKTEEDECAPRGTQPQHDGRHSLSK
jgi:hypothetical protein